MPNWRWLPGALVLGDPLALTPRAHRPHRPPSSTSARGRSRANARSCFSETADGHIFFIDGKQFAPDRIDGAPVPFTGYRDVKSVSPRGRIKLLIPFTNPVIPGKFVHHCHMLSHENNGMMATIRVRE